MGTSRYAAILFCLGLSFAQTSTVPDTWAPLRFLIGAWEGEVSGQPGSGKCEREYRFTLNRKFIEVRNKSIYPVQPKNPKGEVHEDWGMISYDRGRKKMVFRQFHVEGFVNQYSAEVGSDKPVLFQSESIENIPPGFRAREIYTIIGPNEFVERFEMAEPNKDFELYSETRFKRKN
jgi:hypothetical protein